MAISAARKAAYRILLAVERNEGHSDELLRDDPVNALSVVDRNLTTTLVMGVLRWRIRLDEMIRPLLKRPNAKLDDEIRVALEMGAFQLLYLDRIPARAAIDESVELAKRAGHNFAAGMVNAVLRTLARGVTAVDCEATHAYPSWMVERWQRIFGAEAACGICSHGQQQPQLSLRLKDASVEDELTAAGIRMQPGRLLTGARTLLDGDVTATEAYRSGRVRIQDEGSQLVGEIAAVCACGRDEARVLDACAAPGGKTLVLAERLPHARIVACEASAMRHAALRARMAGFGTRIECWLADASTLGEEEAFDLVLADAPCSGTGTLGRNPEIRHQLVEADLARQADRQKAILRAALQAIKTDGRVVYSTCSLEPEENEQVVADVAGELIGASGCLDAMRRNGVLAEAGARELGKCVTPEGALRLMPGVLGTDGFFVAVMRRK